MVACPGRAAGRHALGVYAAIWDIILAEFALFAALFCPMLAWWNVKRARVKRPGGGKSGTSGTSGTKRPLARGIALGLALALVFTAFAELAVRPFWIRHHRRIQVDRLVETLGRSEDVLERRWAASIIWNYARAGGAGGAAGAAGTVPALVRALADADPGVRSTACCALTELGATEALPEIRKLLRDDDERVRGSAAAAAASLEEGAGVED